MPEDARTDEGRAERPAAKPPATRQNRGATLKSDQGVTGIGDTVVAKIAGMATHEIPGVHAMGKGRARAFGTVRGIIPGVASESATQGVSVEVGERQAAIDVDIVVDYGQSIVEVSTAVRANIIERVEEMTGLEVVEVNISIDDVYIGDDEDNTSRVE
ncbi:MAG TPA: Asp23/Gls24 family envelope stress response protein [Acidimicrobiales bacterium]|jgi:uncharacterized alkaline shock family protein YloU